MFFVIFWFPRLPDNLNLHVTKTFVGTLDISYTQLFYTLLHTEEKTYSICKTKMLLGVALKKGETKYNFTHNHKTLHLSTNRSMVIRDYDRSWNMESHQRIYIKMCKMTLHLKENSCLRMLVWSLFSYWAWYILCIVIWCDNSLKAMLTAVLWFRWSCQHAGLEGCLSSAWHIWCGSLHYCSIVKYAGHVM